MRYGRYGFFSVPTDATSAGKYVTKLCMEIGGKVTRWFTVLDIARKTGWFLLNLVKRIQRLVHFPWRLLPEERRTKWRKEGRKEKGKRRNISQHATRRRGTRVVFVASHCTCYCNGMCPVATKCRQNVKLLCHKQGKTPVSTDTYIGTITTLNIDMRILAD